MATKIFTIKDFSGGMTADINTYYQGYCASMLGLTNEEVKGTLKLAYQTSAISVSAVSGTQNPLIALCHYYGDTNYRLYAHDGSYLYAGNATTDTLKWIHNTSANSGITDLKTFSDDTAGNLSLYFASNSYLGKYDGAATTITYDYKNLTTGTPTGYRPMEVFSGNLCVGNGRYIETLEGDGATWNTAALTLPLGTQVFQLITWNDQLVIFVFDTKNDFSGNSLKKAIYFWDGTSSTYLQKIDYTGTGRLAIYLGQLFIINNGSNGVSLYRYNGSIFELFQTLAAPTIGGNYDSIVYDDNIVVSDGKYLVYWGRKDTNSPFSMKEPIKFPAANGSATANYFFNFITMRNTLYTSFQEDYGGASYNYSVAKIITTRRNATGTYDSSRLNMGANWREKFFKSINLEMDALSGSTENIDVWYKTDRDDTWISLCNINSTNQFDWKNIGYRGKWIQIRLVFNAAGTDTDTPILRSINLQYEDL